MTKLTKFYHQVSSEDENTNEDRYEDQEEEEDDEDGEGDNEEDRYEDQEEEEEEGDEEDDEGDNEDEVPDHQPETGVKKKHLKRACQEEGQPKKKKVKTMLQKGEDKTESQDEEESTSDEESSKENPRRIHHMRVKCRMPHCKAVVGDIKRHHLTHEKKREIERKDIPKAAAIMRAGKKQRGPPLTSRKKGEEREGRLKKWCPVQDCCTITHHIDSHLRQSHRLKPSFVEYKIHLNSAKRYTGLAELKMLLTVQPENEVSSDELSNDEEEQMPLSSVIQRPKEIIRPGKGDNDKTGPSPTATEEKEEDPLPAKKTLRAESKPGTSKEVDDSQEEEQDDVEEGDSEETGESNYEIESESSEEETSEEEQGMRKVKKEQYYSATTYENNQWLCGFFKYLHLPAAAYKKLSNRLQHVGQIQALLETLDPLGTDINVLGDENGDVAWTKWVHPHLTNGTKTPGTIISYLTSLEKFFTFITSNKYNRKEMPPLHGNFIVIFWETIPALKGWRATVDNETQDVQHRGHLRECDTLLTAADLDKLKASRPYVAGMKALMQAKVETDLSLQSFSEARDLLLVKFSLLVGSRPAPLENATLEVYYSAKDKG